MRKEMRPDMTIDIRGLIVPVSLLKVGNQLADMQAGQVLEVLCNDGDTRTDLVRIVENSANQCLSVRQVSNLFQILIRKNGK